ncbi:MAG TPA: septal ring lytic transglycosylase RlpA family protein [Bryobacteraceae bacterium]|nr:septal ring lytic transglycosylase RlpA family protein [Bryobacteraceae bacterium]
MMKAVLLTLAALLPIFHAQGREDDLSPVPAGPAVPETGIASWYGYPYHGRHAADGEIYDMEKLTAAHRTLPFGTRVRVVNLRNERIVEVRINDRGPFIEGRIIDLSRAAARAVDMETAGISPVRVEVIEMPREPAGSFGVQVGAFQMWRNAKRCLALMKSRYGAARILLREGGPDLWRVVVGDEATLEGAHALAEQIRQESDGGAFVTRLDR